MIAGQSLISCQSVAARSAIVLHLVGVQLVADWRSIGTNRRLIEDSSATDWPLMGDCSIIIF